jgi:hypothetical protein
MWGASAIFQGVYALLQRLNIPLIVQPQLFGFLCLVSWGQVRRSLTKISTLVAHIILVPILWRWTLAMGSHRHHPIGYRPLWPPRTDSGYLSTGPA